MPGEAERQVIYNPAGTLQVSSPLGAPLKIADPAICTFSLHYWGKNPRVLQLWEY